MTNFNRVPSSRNKLILLTRITNGKPLAIFTILLSACNAVLADKDIHFHDFAADPSSGITFEHVESPRNAILDSLKMNPFIVPDNLTDIPHKPHGAPGVVIFDFDRDDDLDIYVTNSIGGANSLYVNQLNETGKFSFVDAATSTGVAAVDHDSTGVCYGDIDNDGDHDLMVLGAIMPNRLYENQGNGTYIDISEIAGIGGGNLSTSSCSMGDINGDGLLDIAIANTHNNWNDFRSISIPFSFNEHNQLFVNTGDNVFIDVSFDSGFESMDGFPPEFSGSASLTWALSMVDYDQDGDVDILTLDDQGAVPHPFQGGVPYGLIHLFRNDGTGHFVDISVDAGLALPGNWMGVSFGDLDCDGHMDFFASNAGDYNWGQPRVFPLGVVASRWFLSQGDGTFSDPGVGDNIKASTFGWGNSIFDFDNDGDADIIYHGAIDVAIFATASPAVVLKNQGCAADFIYDSQVLVESADHLRRIGQGLASGDLNRDGFVDIVTISNANISESTPLVLSVIPSEVTGSPFDNITSFLPIFEPDLSIPSPLTLRWNGNNVKNGSLTVELNSASNGNNWAEVTLQGTVGLTSEGQVNRDGIGAVVTFSTKKGKRGMVPITGGASYASQNSLAANFGLGSEKKGTIEVLWPGGVRNKFFGVRAGERLVLPEIPVSYDDSSLSIHEYRKRVKKSVSELHAKGLVTSKFKKRLIKSAIRAFKNKNDDK